MNLKKKFKFKFTLFQIELREIRFHQIQIGFSMFAFDFIFPNVYTHSKTVKDFRFSVQDLYNHIFTWEKLRGFIVIME